MGDTGASFLPPTPHPPIPQSPRRRARAAFTLVELLTVITIIAVLMGLVLGVAGFAQRKADRSRAVADLERIKNALEEYRIEYGRYPANTEVASENWVFSLWNKPQMDGLQPFLVNKDWTSSNVFYSFKDPWDRDYRYYHDADGTPFYASNNNSKLGYDLWSHGPEGGVTNTQDDIANWKGDF